MGDKELQKVLGDSDTEVKILLRYKKSDKAFRSALLDLADGYQFNHEGFDNCAVYPNQTKTHCAWIYHTKKNIIVVGVTKQQPCTRFITH